MPPQEEQIIDDSQVHVFVRGEAKMKYLHDNGFRVITLSDLGYDENSSSFYIKTAGVVQYFNFGNIHLSIINSNKHHYDERSAAENITIFRIMFGIEVADDGLFCVLYRRCKKWYCCR